MTGPHAGSAGRAPDPPGEVMHWLRPFRSDRTVSIGDAGYGAAPARLRTLLGSCVAVTLWHPVLRVGRMCHVVSARRPSPDPGHARPIAWFANEAVPQSFRWAAGLDPDPASWQIKVFGGGHQFPVRTGAPDVAAQNLSEVRAQLDRLGVEPVAWHVAGTGSRLVVLDLDDGRIWMAHTPKDAVAHHAHPLRVGRQSPPPLPPAPRPLPRPVPSSLQWPALPPLPAPRPPSTTLLPPLSLTWPPVQRSSTSAR